MPRTKSTAYACCLLPLILTLALTLAASADENPEAPPADDIQSSFSLNNSGHKSWAKFASGTGNIVYLAAGTLLPLVEDGAAGKQHAIRTADALVTSTILAEGLKIVTHERRPNGGDYKSFPSGHATAAFTVATMQAHYHPNQALYWYAGATAIGVSRVALDEHHWHDVFAGAALGYFTSTYELHQHHGILLRPFIHDQGAGQATKGVAAAKQF